MIGVCQLYFPMPIQPSGSFCLVGNPWHANALRYHLNVSSISGIAEGTTAGAHKTSQASEQMSELSSKLQSLVGGFKV